MAKEIIRGPAWLSSGGAAVIIGLKLFPVPGDGCPEGYDFVIALSLGYSTDMKEPHDLREEKISRIE